MLNETRRRCRKTSAQRSFQFNYLVEVRILTNLAIPSFEPNNALVPTSTYKSHLKLDCVDATPFSSLQKFTKRALSEQGFFHLLSDDG
jgi:hypothetical protein